MRLGTLSDTPSLQRLSDICQDNLVEEFSASHRLRLYGRQTEKGSHLIPHLASLCGGTTCSRSLVEGTHCLQIVRRILREALEKSFDRLPRD